MSTLTGKKIAFLTSPRRRGINARLTDVFSKD